MKGFFVTFTILVTNENITTKLVVKVIRSTIIQKKLELTKKREVAQASKNKVVSFVSLGSLGSLHKGGKSTPRHGVFA